MSFELPFVCFSDIPFEDIISDEVGGLVVRKRTPEALAYAIKQLIDHKEFREALGKNAAISVRRFEKEKVAQHMLNFLNL